MTREKASFRDPSGFLFEREGQLYRQVNAGYQTQYEHLMNSGLYRDLTAAGLLVPHQEIDIAPEDPGSCYKVIKPTRLALISYPYEWCFSQLKDAALATLEIQCLAMKHGMSLKDASAYNIQFHQGRPILIDTLSFDMADMTRPWVAYRQFCQHFLAPLSLMSHRDIRLGQLLRIHIDGLPLDLASRLLPTRTRFSFSLLSHIHLHARSQQKHADSAVTGNPQLLERKISPLGFKGLISSLQNTTRALKRPIRKTEWGEYYSDTNYSDKASDDKAVFIGRWIEKIAPKNLWDLGANTGRYTRLASQRGVAAVAFDIDPTAVEYNYSELQKKGETNILPLLLDLTNPSPALGWANRERGSLGDRGPVDMLMALALVHHLAISNNVPLPMIAGYFASLCRHLIIEFVPKEDSQVRRLLASRQDIFSDYHSQGLETAFQENFHLLERHQVSDSDRILYLYEKK